MKKLLFFLSVIGLTCSAQVVSTLNQPQVTPVIGTNSSSGGSASQTPLTNNVNGASFTISNASFQNVKVTSTNDYNPTPLLITATAGNNFVTISGGSVSTFNPGDEITINGNVQYWIVDVTNSPASFTVFPQISTSVTNSTNWHVFPCTFQVIDDIPRVTGGWNGDSALFITGLYGSQGNSGQLFFCNGAKTWQMQMFDDSTGVAFTMGGLPDSRREVVHIYYDAPGNSLDVAHDGALAPNKGLTNELTANIDFHVPASMPSAIITNTVTSYHGDTTAGNGLESVLASISLTNQSASIASNTIFTVTTAGLYGLEGYAEITTGGPSTGALTVTSFWQDSIGNTSAVMAPAVVATSQTRFCLPDDFDLLNGGLPPFPYIYCVAGSTIKYSTTYAGGTGNAMRYNIRLVVKRKQ